MRLFSRRRLGVGTSMLGLAIVVTSSVIGSASAQDQGNNGTVKVDEHDLSPGPGPGPGDDPGNNNDPHISCDGQVEWYGFDEGVQTATVTFTVWPPTSQTAPAADTVHQVVFDDIEGDGPGVPNDEADFDGIMPFDLSVLLEPFTPHEPQGFHVKVEVETTFAQGPSDSKFKVFWVDECEDEVVVVATTTTTSTTTTSTTSTTLAAPPVTGEVGGAQVTPVPAAPQPVTEVAGVVQAAPAAAVTALPRTGFDPGLLLMLGGTLVVSGILLLRYSAMTV